MSVPAEKLDPKWRIAVSNALVAWLEHLKVRQNRPAAYGQALRGVWDKCLRLSLNDYEEGEARKRLFEYVENRRVGQAKVLDVVAQLWRVPRVNEGELQELVNKALLASGSRYRLDEGVWLFDGAPVVERPRLPAGQRDVSERIKMLEKFTQGDGATYPCPRCSSGRLSFVEPFVAVPTSRASAVGRQQDATDFPRESRFVAVLECGDAGCREMACMSGMATSTEGDHPSISTEVYEPRYFMPAPPLFPVSQRWPRSIKAELARVFEHFWFDGASCANRIRICLERLLDHQRVAKVTVGAKPRPLSLHARIEAFGTAKAPALKEYLLAVKWLGNDGSHAGEKLARADICDGLDLLRHILETVFDQPPETKRLQGLARKLQRRR